ncbi:MAG: glycosyltransferase family 4 protein [Cyanobacteria bacterium P01_E01_bin.34]
MSGSTPPPAAPTVCSERAGTDSKLIVLSAYTSSFGGMTVSLSMLIAGFKQLGMGERLVVVTKAGSLQEQYLLEAGHVDCLQSLESRPGQSFSRTSLQWVHQQPHHWPLLLESWVLRNRMFVLLAESKMLRRQRRPLFHFFHDLAISYNPIGNWVRKFVFSRVAPGAICNSNFTASVIRQYVTRDIRGVLYQPVDPSRFERSRIDKPPEALRSLIDSNIGILLTPSRLNKPGIVNDKNLRALIPVLAELKAMGHRYQSVIIGADGSTDGSYTRSLQELAYQYGVGDWLTILPPVFDIESYFVHADATITLAPREPFGRTVVEAIASGVPVIGSNTGGIAEILNNFAPDWTVDPNDPEAVARRICALRTSAERTARQLKAGREWVEQNCHVARYAHGIATLTGLEAGCLETDCFDAGIDRNSVHSSRSDERFQPNLSTSQLSQPSTHS